MDSSIYKTMDTVESYHWWFVSRAKIIEELLKNIFKDKKQLEILDLGCGSGGNFKMLKTFGNVTGIEPDKYAYEHAKLKNIAKEVINDDFVTTKSLTNKQFDLIVLSDVLEHIENDIIALSKIYDLLNTGGVLLITVPANMNLWSNHDITHHHYRRYSYNELKEKLLNANFKIDFLSYYNFFLYPLVFVGRKLKLNNYKDDVDMTNDIVNKLFKFIFSFERHFIANKKRLPKGVSLITICKK